jgi:hypothetical protein
MTFCIFEEFVSINGSNFISMVGGSLAVDNSIFINFSGVSVFNQNETK